ncbi:hypothetical protein FQR65_LT20677 [Abscondita terminalis]|nr:hypothetical protein FQR65_LT20677 [Abscondita terminalis]
MNVSASSCPEAETDLPADEARGIAALRRRMRGQYHDPAHDCPFFPVWHDGAARRPSGGRPGARLCWARLRRSGIIAGSALRRMRVPGHLSKFEAKAGFRRRESAALEECTQRRNIILATGGGAILAPENRQRLHERGIVVYLRASVDELFRRTCRDRNRPLLATADPKGTLRELMTGREPFYRRSRRPGVCLPQLQAFEKRQLNVVDVTRPGASYPINIGPGRLDHLHERPFPPTPPRSRVVTNPTVWPRSMANGRGRAATRSGQACACASRLPGWRVVQDWQFAQPDLRRLAVDSGGTGAACWWRWGGGVIGDMTGLPPPWTCAACGLPAGADHTLLRAGGLVGGPGQTGGQPSAGQET